MQRTCMIITLFLACVLAPGLRAEDAEGTKNYKGAVVAVAEDGSSVTIQPKAKKGKDAPEEVTLKLDENTEFVGQLASAADLTEGMKIKIIATDDHADQVMVNDGKKDKKEKKKKEKSEEDGDGEDGGEGDEEGEG